MNNNMELEPLDFNDGKCIMRYNEMGRGAYALVDIPKGRIIHRAPVIAMSEEYYKYIEGTDLVNHAFDWTPDGGPEGFAICLGYGTIFNHSFKPNAYYISDFKNLCLVFKSYKDIKAGEEIYTNYNGDSNSYEELPYDWFDKSMIPTD